MSKFDDCLEIILKHEGGYVNHPQDPGGETNMGITKRVYEEFGGTKDMKDLEFDDVAPIYKQNYWDRLRCDDLPEGLDLCIFDFGVNAGTGRAAKKLQMLIGAKQDGALGPKSMRKVKEYVDDKGIEEVIREYQNLRHRYYRQLKTFKTFGKGWTRRVDETTDHALHMA